MGRLPSSVSTQHSLADLVELQRGYDLTAAERMPGTFPVIGGGGPNGTHDTANVSGPGVVVVRSGSGFGNVWWVEEDFWAHNTVMFAKSFKGNHKKFAYYVLDWLDFTSYNSGGAQPSLNRNFIYAIPVFLPSATEQERIAGIIETWDRAIETVEALIANARAQKQALLQQLLPQSTEPPKKRLLGFSEKWREAKLGSLADISKGEQKGRADLSEEGPVPVINGGITPSGYTDHPNTAANTITISEGGNSCGHVDLIKQPFWCGGHCYALKNLKVDRDFLFAVLKHRQPEIMSLRVGSGLPNIQKKALSPFSIPVPPKPEQVKIGELAANADKEISAHEAQLTALRREKAALMQQLLTGKRRVKLDQKEAA